MITYLQAVNRVLVKLRQSQVSTLNGADEYTSLIAAYVNEAKEEVEDAWRWSTLQNTISISLVGGQTDYSLTGSGENYELYDIWNVTNRWRIQGPFNSMFVNRNYILSTGQGAPAYFDFHGQDANGDQVIRFQPTPATTGTIVNVYGYSKQGYLSTTSDDSTRIKVPWKPVVYGAYAKAVSERGEDGGVSFAEANAMYLQVLADAIAMDVRKEHESNDWYPS